MTGMSATKTLKKTLRTTKSKKRIEHNSKGIIKPNLTVILNCLGFD